LVCSVQSLLGYGLGPSQAALLERERAGEAIKRPYLKQSPNFLGHSYTHRFILGCLTKKAGSKQTNFSELSWQNCRGSCFHA
jgi:hypothetical protein